MKKEYEVPKLEEIVIELSDIIADSGLTNKGIAGLDWGSDEGSERFGG